MYIKFNIVLLLLLKLRLAFASHHVTLTSDSPVVRGGTVHFVATLYEDGEPALGEFKYIWIDNSTVMHNAEHETKSNVDTWNVMYPASETFPAGPYEVHVTIWKWYVFFMPR